MEKEIVYAKEQESNKKEILPGIFLEKIGPNEIWENHMGRRVKTVKMKIDKKLIDALQKENVFLGDLSISASDKITLGASSIDRSGLTMARHTTEPTHEFHLYKTGAAFALEGSGGILVPRMQKVGRSYGKMGNEKFLGWARIEGINVVQELEDLGIMEDIQKNGWEQYDKSLRDPLAIANITGPVPTGNYTTTIITEASVINFGITGSTPYKQTEYAFCDVKNRKIEGKSDKIINLPEVDASE